MEEIIQNFCDWWMSIGTQWRCILIALAGCIVNIISSTVIAVRTAKDTVREWSD